MKASSLKANEAEDLAPLLWPLERLGEALEELARRARLRLVAGDNPPTPATLAADGPREQGRWIEWAAQRLGLEAEALCTAWAPGARSRCCAAPARRAKCWKRAGQIGFLLLLKCTGARVHS